MTESLSEKNTMPWIEEFRPQQLSQIISNDRIIDTLKEYVKKKFLPHLLLHGPSGTGKSSTIKACANQIYGENYDVMVLQINASKDRGIEVVRNKIRDFIITRSTFFEMKDDLFKLVILDEADAMTSDAQYMLRRLIEDNTMNARFCLICNKVKNIDPALQSRCTSFRFAPLSKTDIMNRIDEVAKIKKLNITQDGIDTIIDISKGDMRKVLNILQTTSMAYKKIDADNVTTCIGYPKKKDIDRIFEILMNDNCIDAEKKITKIKNDNGYSLLEIITELHKVLIKKYTEKKSQLTDDFMMSILIGLKNVETNLILCPTDHIQLAGIIGTFNLNKD